MVHLGSYCIDQYEVSSVDLNTGQRLSPFYPPERKLLRFVYQYWRSEAAKLGSTRARRLALPIVPEVQKQQFKAKAQSVPGVLPQGYMSYYSARRACSAANKRLCTEDEWTHACKGSKHTKQPYGANYKSGRCNIYRSVHPAYVLHGNSSLGHLDPRLHLVFDDKNRPLLELTGQRTSCVSSHKDGPIFDMVGNLDEWIEDDKGVFKGGFYARGTRKGCEARVENHGKSYADYSLGTRCCKDAR